MGDLRSRHPETPTVAPSPIASPNEALLAKADKCDRAIVRLTTDPGLMSFGGASLRIALEALAEARDALRWSARTIGETDD